MLLPFSKNFEDLNLRILTKIIPVGTIKKLRFRKLKGDIEDANEHEDTRRKSLLRSASPDKISRSEAKKTIINSSQLLAKSTQRHIRITKETSTASNSAESINRSPKEKSGNHSIRLFNSAAAAPSDFLSPDLTIDVNLKMINTNNTFDTNSDVWSYNPEEGHTSAAKNKSVKFI